MTKKKNDKKITRLTGSFKDILICQKKQDRPYLEIFTLPPENVAEENLGTLSGLFEINDNSENSSYIVNYLISVIKKEYFSKTKRGPIESLEASLHKANLALAQLAEHGDIEWIGKLNGIICVIEKNNIHLSQTGSARALLLRGKILTDITEGAEIPEVANPLKTFVDVLSGRLEPDDRLIITTANIFDIFSFEEIKRSAIKFAPSDFVQFLHTALVNELDRAAVLIVDVFEKIEEALSPVKRPAQINAFSREAFAKALPKPVLAGDERQNLVQELKEEIKKRDGDFVDEKTGHIYIKEDYFLKEDSPKLSEFMGNISAKFSHPLAKLPDALVAVRQEFQEKGRSHIKKRREKRKEKEAARMEKANFFVRHQTKIKKLNDFAKLLGRSIVRSIKFLVVKIKIATVAFLSFVIVLVKKLSLFIRLKLANRKSRKVKYHFRTGENIAKKMGRASFSDVRAISPENSDLAPAAPNQESLASNLRESKLKIFPSFSKIKNILGGFSYAQKFYVILILVFILVVPYFIVKWQNIAATKKADLAPASELVVPLVNDKNVNHVENLNQVYSADNIQSLINLNGKFFVAGSSGIVDVANNKIYSYPDGFSNAKIFCAMDDLNLLFALDENNKIIAWSPTTGKFQDNNISIAQNSNIIAVKSYLTYLYLLDSANNQIYRYPRATGGFGDKADWLKVNSDLSGARDMALTDNIYVANSGNILKFFRGKNQDFNLEATATPISIDKIYTHPDSQNIYILDKTNSRIIKLDLNGNIVTQYYNSKIASVVDFSVDETNNLIYFTNGSDIKSFSM